MKPLKLLCCLLALVFVSSCNLRPVYQRDASIIEGVTYDIKSFKNTNPAFNFALKDALNDVFIKSQQSRYQLDIELRDSATNFSSQSNTTYNRTKIDLVANFKLSDLGTGKVILKDKAIVSDSFEINNSPYSSLVSEEETYSILAVNLSHQLKHRVASALANTY